MQGLIFTGGKTAQCTFLFLYVLGGLSGFSLKSLTFPVCRIAWAGKNAIPEFTKYFFAERITTSYWNYNTECKNQRR